jgi:hypothetical protein
VGGLSDSRLGDGVGWPVSVGATDGLLVFLKLGAGLGTGVSLWEWS